MDLYEAVEKDVSSALEEDVGKGDVTASLVPADALAYATVIGREDAVICGIPWFEACFRKLDPAVEIVWQVSEGDEIRASDILCTLHGNARALLSAERCALNFLQLLSGIATKTTSYVKAVEGTRAKVMDTRKTLPGLRYAQKYAVRIGGGENQRMGLYDAILIKENHILACGGVRKALEAASGSFLPVQIEVENMEELGDALEAGAKLILLDNFDVEGLKKAVEFTAGRALLEASGGVDLDTVGEIAETGVDRISVGSLTKDARRSTFPCASRFRCSPEKPAFRRALVVVDEKSNLGVRLFHCVLECL
ncbi:MAG TPA: carboxylating nicotinate-nucleotide diphosphorylase [Burkholderiales bacterium]|nr:carboxylating nicotinate-nucleotide diphosphorylase [Burkholderiales bacterium]